MSDNRYWLGFTLIPGFGPKRIFQLRDWFDDLATAWQASDESLKKAGIPSALRVKLHEYRQKLDLPAELTRIKVAGAQFVTYDDDTYPAPLREINDPPPILYIRGQLLPQDRRALAIVGTRKPSRYGYEAAKDLSGRLAAQGVTIISGMALGIDSAAHRGAIEAGGRTIAVLGCGIDILYPSDNYKLAQQILKNGAIISEFPLGTKPLGTNFPRRNRIVSGLSLGVMVAEAPESSGALITASLAAEQGREVFAIPANIYNQTGRGCNRLLQDGAKLVMSEKDVLEEFNIAFEHAETRQETRQIAPANDIEAQIIELLEVEPIHIDDIVRRSNLPAAQVSSTLTILELKGLAKAAGHMQYCRI